MTNTTFTPNPFAAENARLAELRKDAQEMAANSPLRLDSTEIRMVGLGISFNHGEMLQNHAVGAGFAARAGDPVLAAALNRVRN